MRHTSCLRLPHLQRVRISAPLPFKCFERIYPEEDADWVVLCAISRYGLQYAYKVKQIYYEFSASKTPMIDSGPWTCSAIDEADQFSFINLDWSESDPTLSSCLCEHAQRNGRDYVKWSTYTFQPPLTFLKIFNKVTFIGIPDYILTLSKLTKNKTLIWKRLMPVNRAVTMAQPIIHCPSLETLHLTTLLKKQDHETDPMPKLDSPVVHRIYLCSVHGSQLQWNLNFHFTPETLSSVKLMSIKLNSDDFIPLTLMDLAPVSNLESISVHGYHPSFVESIDEDLGVVFSRLTTLSFDVGYLPLDSFPGQIRPLGFLFLDRDIFPVLKHLTLDLASRKRSPLLYDGLCNVTVQVPWSCQLLTVLEPLAVDTFFIAREDKERCQGRTVHSNDLVADKPGYLRYNI